MGITLARIDNRLLHGIVATQWAGRSGAQRIMIIDDGVANNELTKASMKLARPTGMAISIITLEKALTNFKAGKYDDHNVFVIVKSPVGMPGRAIRNAFLERVAGQKAKIENCYQCLEHCDPKNIPYCITKALSNAAEGKLEDALLFCGSNAYRANRIETVDAVIADLVGAAV